MLETFLEVEPLGRLTFEPKVCNCWMMNDEPSLTTCSNCVAMLIKGSDSAAYAIDNTTRPAPGDEDCDLWI